MRIIVLFIVCFCLTASLTSDMFSQAVKRNKTGKNDSATVKLRNKNRNKAKTAKNRVEPVCTLPVSVTALTLSKDRLVLSCKSSKACIAEPLTVDVAVTTVASDKIKYIYLVSGGKIVGSGPNVVWDLTGVKPGTYTLTAGIDEGTGYGVMGMTQTRVVTVTECMDCIDKP